MGDWEEGVGNRKLELKPVLYPPNKNPNAPSSQSLISTDMKKQVIEITLDDYYFLSEIKGALQGLNLNEFQRKAVDKYIDRLDKMMNRIIHTKKAV